MIGLELADRLGEYLRPHITIGNTRQIGVPAKEAVTPRKKLNRVGHTRDLHNVTDGNTAPIEATNATDNDQKTARDQASVANTTIGFVESPRALAAPAIPERLSRSVTKERAQCRRLAISWHGRGAWAQCGE